MALIVAFLVTWISNLLVSFALAALSSLPTRISAPLAAMASPASASVSALSSHTLSALEEIGGMSPLYLRPCVTLLQRVLDAVVAAPAEAKYRRLNVHKLRPKLRTLAALKLLQSVGFEPQERGSDAEEEFMVMQTPNPEQIALLQRVRDSLQELVTKDGSAAASASASSGASAASASAPVAPFPTASSVPHVKPQHPEEGELVEDDRFVLFWHAPSWPAQWAQVSFVVDGVLYLCAEQYMMAQKAKLFGDHAAFARILTEASPRLQKKLGQGVKGFDQATWEKRRLDIVTQANYAKFSQNPAFRARLLATGDKIIAEASPLDAIWGIGLAADHPNARSKGKWRGTNLLGVALMNVRDRLRKEDAEAAAAAKPNK